MRKIDKGEPMAEFEQFVRSHNPRCWEDSAGISRVWREYMLEFEQHKLSAYTELYLLDLNETHIDHFKKRELFNDLVFNWNNLVVDSKDDSFGARYKDNHIHSQLDNERLINPIEEDAASFFQYVSTGKMIPAEGLTDDERQRAQYTIEMFNLNESGLMDRRKSILNNDISAYNGLSDEDVLQYLQELGFPSVIEQLLKERKQRRMLYDDKET